MVTPANFLACPWTAGANSPSRLSRQLRWPALQDRAPVDGNGVPAVGAMGL